LAHFGANQVMTLAQSDVLRHYAGNEAAQAPDFAELAGMKASLCPLPLRPAARWAWPGAAPSHSTLGGWLGLLIWLALGSTLYAQPPGQDPFNPDPTLASDMFLSDTLTDSALGQPDVPLGTAFYRPAALWAGWGLPDSVPHLNPRRDSRPDPALDFRIHHWDEVDTLPGFRMLLGQIGKPYQGFRYGLNHSHWADLQLYRDPLTGLPDAYMQLANTLPFVQSRTPFIDVSFAQNSNETQLLHLVLSQNISPAWNLTLRWRRRTAQGPYSSFVTDHFQAAATLRFQPIDAQTQLPRRYHALAWGQFNQLSDGIHGGTFQDGTVPFAQSFDKFAEAMQLPDAQLVRRMRSVGIQHHYRLAGKAHAQAPSHQPRDLESDGQPTHVDSLLLLDSMPKHVDFTSVANKVPGNRNPDDTWASPAQSPKVTEADSIPSSQHLAYQTGLWLQHRFELSEHLRRFTDQSLNPQTGQSWADPALNADPHRPYGRVWGDLTERLSEQYVARTRQQAAGLRWATAARAQGRPLGYLSVLGEAYWRQVQVDTLLRVQSLNFTGLSGTVRLSGSASDAIRHDDPPAWVLQLRLRQQIADRFAPEQYAEACAEWYPQQRRLALEDSTLLEPVRPGQLPPLPAELHTLHRPWAFGATAWWHSRNPSLLAALGQSRTLRGDGGLANEQILHLQAHGRWQAAPRLVRRTPRLPNFLSLRFFHSQTSQPIYWGPDAQPLQLGSGTPALAFSGTELSGRVRFWRLYLGGSGTAQASSGGTALLRRQQPAGHGMLELFYADDVFKQAAYVQLGFEAHGFTAFDAWTFEPSQQIWFPRLPYRAPGYVRFDLVARAQIRSVAIFLKMIHLNEGFGQPGYYTTPFYPMLDRSFSFGVRWRFFD
jgi:hypothetical protein